MRSFSPLGFPKRHILLGLMRQAWKEGPHKEWGETHPSTLDEWAQGVVDQIEQAAETPQNADCPPPFGWIWVGPDGAVLDVVLAHQPDVEDALVAASLRHKRHCDPFYLAWSGRGAIPGDDG